MECSVQHCVRRPLGSTDFAISSAVAARQLGGHRPREPVPPGGERRSRRLGGSRLRLVSVRGHECRRGQVGCHGEIPVTSVLQEVVLDGTPPAPRAVVAPPASAASTGQGA
jgi:hypothetical protein